MAKKRYNFQKRSRRRSSSFSPSRRRSRSSGSGGISPLVAAGGGALYGAFRGDIVKVASPVLAYLPLGNMADEVAMATGGYLLTRMSNGYAKKAGLIILTVEGAMAGSQLRQGSIFSASSSNSGTLF